MTTANDTALFGYSNGSVYSILREGDVVDVDPTATVDNRTVSAFSYPALSGGDDGKASPLNDSGTLVYRVTFTDASQALFTSSIVPVPEPSTWIAAGLLVVGVGVRHLRSRAKAKQAAA